MITELFGRTPVEAVPLLRGTESPPEGAGLVRCPVDVSHRAEGGITISAKWDVTEQDGRPAEVFAIGIVLDPGGPAVLEQSVGNGLGDPLRLLAGDTLTWSGPWPPESAG